ncbi:MAG: SprB repeat-containing protein [Chitinophagaceae bacterium]|nr:SprB repeat-containing protein [Chitinophagaceae bacterium]
MKQLLHVALTLFCITFATIVYGQCPVALTYTSTNVSCFLGTNGSITATASGGSAPYQYQLAEAGAGAWSTNNVFTGLAAGTYPVSAKDGAGCVKTVYVVITQPSALTVSYSASNPVCSGANNGTISTQVSGGVAPYTYNWTKNGSAYSTSSNLTGLGAGNYQVIVTDASGCSASPPVAQQVQPLSLTGFNEDVVANGTGTASTSSTSRAVDAAPGYVFFAAGYSNPSNSSGSNGLPANGSFNSAQDASRNYQLASYSSNNVLLLRSSGDNANGGATSGTLTFASQFRSNYATLYVVGTTGSGTGTINYQVNYSDATTSTGTLNFPDWYLSPGSSSSIRAIGNLNRVTRTSSASYETGGNFNLFEAPITISASNQNKVINSVTFTWSGSGSARTNLFAITGYTSTSNGIRINEGPASSVVPAVSITSNAPGNKFCSGQSVTFTATPTNGGTSPSYQWKVNGSNAGTNSPTFTSTSLANNSQVSVVLTAAGNVGCLSTSSATSNIITMTTATQAASVAVGASSTSICSGTNVVFTATPTNGGTAPSYQWRLNGINVGANGNTWSSSSLVNNDAVTVIMTSNTTCVTNNPATAPVVNMTVSPVSTPSAVISGTKVNPGLLLNSTVANVGTTPAYQWYKNGVAVPNATASTLSAPTATVGEIYSLKVTSSNVCSSPAATMSNYVTITPAILPIKLESFRAQEDGGVVKLTWKTGFEEDLVIFDIQRSEDANGGFESIGNVQPKNAARGANYSFDDEPGKNGTYYYRLVQKEKNEKTVISGTVSIRLTGITDIRIATKTSSWKIFTTGYAKYWLVDAFGVKVDKGEAEGNFEVAKPKLKGIYYLQMQKNKDIFIFKIVN